MILTTTNSIEHHKIVDYLGIVTGVKVNTKKQSFTFKLDQYYQSLETNINEVKEEAFQKLRENAKLMNANAVVGIVVDIETFPGTTYIFVSVTGTAVKVAYAGASQETDDDLL